MPVKVLLQEIRKSKGLSQNELARLTNMSPQNIQKIEQGQGKRILIFSKIWYNLELFKYS